MKLNKIHHIAVICSDYEKSKHLYTDVLGMKIFGKRGAAPSVGGQLLP